MPRISLEDRLARLERMFKTNTSIRRKFEADEDEPAEDASADKEDLDKAGKDPEVQDKIAAITNSLKDAGLIDFVQDVNTMMSDEKGRLALELVAGTLSADQLEEMGLKNVKFKFVANAATPVKNLHPTQNEIGFSNSLKFPVQNAASCQQLIAGDSVKIKIPIITCNGSLIIDGHHRWSQTACVNPDATMEALDLQIITQEKGIDFKKASDVLKVTQALIMALVLKAGKTKLPSASSGKLENLYAMSPDQLFKSIVNFDGSHDGLEYLATNTSRVRDADFEDLAGNVNKAIAAITDERIKAVKSPAKKPDEAEGEDETKEVPNANFNNWNKLSSDAKAAIYLTANCMVLPKPAADATLRKYMPQTDGAGDVNITLGDLKDAASNGLNVKESRFKHNRIAKLESRIANIEKALSRKNK